MHRLSFVALILALGIVLTAQVPDREVVATISGPALANGVVSGVAWDGAAIVIQTAAVAKDGTRAARYFVVPGRGMSVQPVKEAPPGVEQYWNMKSSRISPTGLGKIAVTEDAKLPMYGIASQEQRFKDAMDMGGQQVTSEVRLGEVVLHRRAGPPPYDGEMWSWSPAELNRVAYVNEKGELWIARADGTAAERLLKGTLSLPAWSDDGRLLAVAERKNDGAKWEVSVIHLPERFWR